jgi:hypothetical protein
MHSTRPAPLLIALYGELRFRSELNGRSAVWECVSVLVRCSVYIDTTNRLLLQGFCIFATTRNVRS